jgi:hypothetical protein
MAGGSLAGVLLGISAMVAQPNPVLSALGIDLWPDYDRPGVLVIYRATIAPDVPQPTRLAVRIPAAAGLPNAVAERLADGQLITLPYERIVDGATARITLTTSQPTVQLEYYDPVITRDGARRRFAFTWPGDLEVRDFSISVQQPRGAQAFTTIPGATRVAASADGLTYHALSRTGVKAGETVEVQVSYEKASDQLTTEAKTPAATPPVPPPPANAVSSGRTVPIVLSALFLCAAAVTVGLAARARRLARAAPRSTAPPTARSRGLSRPATRFCTQCGVGVDTSDRFCRRCGAALKP